MNQQIPLEQSDLADLEKSDDGTWEVRPDLAYKRLLMVNVVFFGMPGDRNWVLIDTGLPGSAGVIKRAAAKRFGEDARPVGIIMTHGHFDHTGALETLVKDWNVPVYAHALELPYLNGTTSYPPPDVHAGGGIMPLTAPLYPRGPVNVGDSLQELPADRSVPGMPGWHWIPTPGHTPGHVSLWRDRDRTLISADAVITTRQESAYAIVTQEPELHGPPKYFTPDWLAAEESVKKIAALQPELIVPGHGQPAVGEGLRTGLENLARNFKAVAVPEHLQRAY